MSIWQRVVRYVVCFGIVLGAAAVPTAAHAQDDKAKAIQLIKEANAATEQGEHRDALLKYKAAFDLTEDPRILYRVGLSYESLGNYQRAREHLELYLFADPDSEYKDRIEKKIALLEEKEKTLQARVEIASNPSGALVFVDGVRNKPYGKTPLVLPVGPGKHTLLVKKGGAEQTFSVTISEGQTVTQTIELGPRALEAEDEKETAPTEDVVTTTGEQTPSGVDSGNRVVTRVDIAPPMYLLVIGWSLVGTAMVMGLAALAADNSLVVYGIGAAAFIGGGFILWFNQDSHTDQLERIGTEAGPSANVYGAGWQFEF